MKAFKASRLKGSEAIEISVDEALQKVKAFNAEFCKEKSDEELIREMKVSPIYTNLAKYWVEQNER